MCGAGERPVRWRPERNDIRGGPQRVGSLEVVASRWRVGVALMSVSGLDDVEPGDEGVEITEYME